MPDSVYASKLDARKVMQFRKDDLLLLAESIRSDDSILGIVSDVDFIYSFGVGSYVNKLTREGLLLVASFPSYGTEFKAGCVDDNFLYIGHALGGIFKLNKSDLSFVDIICNLKCNIYCMVELDDYLYVSTSETAVAVNEEGYNIMASIFKIHKSGAEPVQWFDFTDWYCFCLLIDNGFLYVGHNYLHAVVTKIDLVSGQVVATSPEYGRSICCIAKDDNFIYIAGEQHPVSEKRFTWIGPETVHYVLFSVAKVFLLNKVTLAKESESLDYGGAIFCLVIDSDSIFLGGAFNCKVWRLCKLAYSLIDETIDAGSNVSDLALSYIYRHGIPPYLTDWLYCTLIDGQVWKIQKKYMSRINLSDQYPGQLYCLTGDYDFIFIDGSYGQTWKIKTSDMTTEAQGPLYQGEIYAIDSDNNYLYRGGVLTLGDWTERRPAGDADKGWSSVASSADGSFSIACINGGRLYTSIDFGVSWTERRPVGDINNSWSSVACNSDGSKLITCARGDFLYTSNDFGVTWTKRILHPNYKPTWTGVASSANGNNLIAIAHGIHNNLYGYTGVFTSSDSGVTWIIRSPAGPVGLSDWHYWTRVASSDIGDHLILSSIGSAGELSGRVFTSEDYGVTWTERRPAGDISRYWLALACNSDGSRLVAGAWAAKLYISNDGGISWTETQPAGDTNRQWNYANSNAEGSFLIVCTSHSAFGRIFISKDFGIIWTETQPAGDVNRTWSSVSISRYSYFIIVCAAGGRLYTLFPEATSYIEKSRKSNLSLIKRSPDYGAPILSICLDDNFVFCAGEMPVARVCKYSIDSLSFVRQSISYSGNINCLAISENWLFCAGDVTSKVWKLNKEWLSLSASSADYDGNILCMVVDGDFIFIGGTGCQRIRKLNISDLSPVSFSEPIGEDIISLRVDVNFIFTGGNSHKVKKFSKSNLQLVAVSKSEGGSVLGLTR